jgi:YD repeat-containing protein
VLLRALPDSTTTQFAYDDEDRLTSVTDAATNVTSYGYDTENNLTSIQDANHNTTNFSYDAFGRVARTSFPSGYVETYGSAQQRTTCMLA